MYQSLMSLFINKSLLYFLTLFTLGCPLDSAPCLMVEICNNALDDDGDGLIDLNDSDCACDAVVVNSLIRNPSFEQMNCCPDAPSQAGCANEWVTTSATPDYLNLCDFFQANNDPVPMPFPDGNGVLGIASQGNEYIGICLVDTLFANSQYLLEFFVGFSNNQRSPPINFTLFGTTECNNLSQDNRGCPSELDYWVELGSKEISGGIGDTWVKSALEIVPQEDIVAIIIGGECVLDIQDDIYHYLDKIILQDFQDFEFNISETSPPCSDTFSLNLPYLTKDLPYELQWYKDGVTLIGETTKKLSRMYGDGNYQVRMISESDCLLSDVYKNIKPVFHEDMEEVICIGETYDFGNLVLTEPGMYLDTIKNEDNCDVIVNLNLKVGGEITDTITVKIVEGQTYEIGSSIIKDEGEHLVNIASTQECDDFVAVLLEFFDVYIPDAFSPNHDGINDEFTIFVGDESILDRRITIYDRWGNMIFEGAAWNGEAKSGSVPIGVYTYVADITFEDGKVRKIPGTVTVVR